VRGGSGEADLLHVGGPAVGLIDGAVVYETAVAEMAPGDVFVFYTDGITEAENESGADFGRERLVDLVQSCRGRRADAVVTAIHDAVEGFAGPLARGDDATVIVARVPAGRAPQEEPR
jgi:sigma-B regulation protein RsbU (phosphoserine phosphatase)